MSQTIGARLFRDLPRLACCSVLETTLLTCAFHMFRSLQVGESGAQGALLHMFSKLYQISHPALFTVLNLNLLCFLIFLLFLNEKAIKLEEEL